MRRILVVDDEPDIRELLVDILRGEGFQLMIANDGVEALEMLAREEVDLVITDTMMPRVGGVELVRSMRERSDFREIPAILMSAGGKPGLDGLGSVAFLPKPFDLIALLDAVAERLKATGSGDGSSSPGCRH